MYCTQINAHKTWNELNNDFKIFSIYWSPTWFHTTSQTGFILASTFTLTSTRWSHECQQGIMILIQYSKFWSDATTSESEGEAQSPHPLLHFGSPLTTAGHRAMVLDASWFLRGGMSLNSMSINAHRRDVMIPWYITEDNRDNTSIPSGTKDHNKVRSRSSLKWSSVAGSVTMLSFSVRRSISVRPPGAIDRTVS